MMTQPSLQRWLGAILPNRCLMCHQQITSTQSGICRVCLNACLYQTPVCLGCGREMQLQVSYCGECQRHNRLKVVAPCGYHDGLGHWVGQIKYQAQFAVIEVMVDALIRRLHHLIELGFVQMPQVIIAVPLHSKRLRQRGFNQAWLVAQSLSQKLELPLLDDVLIRQTNTAPQAGLSGKMRRQNLLDAFTLVADINWQRIAIVDDVVTTGTTVSEIARLFNKQYIETQVWCLARAEAPGLN
ncbi:ComF family protein [Shewanella gelidimarina]|uniref:ComF family protein n=1 Tax=Shewanella gelidimarina TaxID=56813 RepID=UPI00200D9AC2|nr:ComF family protein [Shewanella gelidimarina]MCL1056538.1 ComF family protein [Shewanella gelidimarina]